MAHKLISKQALECACTFAAKDAARYALNGVCLSERGIEASDGRRAVRISWLDERPDEFPTVGQQPSNGATLPDGGIIMPLESAKAIAKALPKASRIPVLTRALLDVEASSREKAVAYTTDLENTRKHEARALDGEFPDLSECIPSSTPVVTFGVNAKLLAEVAKALSLLDEQITIQVRSGTEPIVFHATSQDGEHAVAMLMPMA